MFIVGCEPAEVDELTTELTPPVQAAVGAALEHIDRLLASGGAGADPVAALQQRDEILQIMFWLHGEGLGPDVGPADILRFVDDSVYGARDAAAARGGRVCRAVSWMTAARSATG